MNNPIAKESHVLKVITLFVSEGHKPTYSDVSSVVKMHRNHVNTIALQLERKGYIKIDRSVYPRRLTIARRATA